MKTKTEILNLWNDHTLCPDFKPVLDELVNNLETLQVENRALKDAVYMYERHVDHHIEFPDEKPAVTLKYAIKARKEANEALSKIKTKVI